MTDLFFAWVMAQSAGIYVNDQDLYQVTNHSRELEIVDGWP